MKMTNNEEAVSPVIGVILMVAITVILAAVIAAFVFGLAGTTQATKNVGVIVTQNATGFGEITWQGGADITKITNWTAKTANGTSLATHDAIAPVVGQVNITTIKVNNERVIITAKFQDGSSAVIYDKTF